MTLVCPCCETEVDASAALAEAASMVSEPVVLCPGCGGGWRIYVSAEFIGAPERAAVEAVEAAALDEARTGRA